MLSLPAPQVTISNSAMHRFESQVNMLLNDLAGQVRDAGTIYVSIY